MLGFTLSKINLLIFVVAVFSIVLFFVFSFSQILVENIANDYVRIHAQDAFTLVGSPTLCAAQIHYLKDSIEASSGNTGRGLYYVLNIKQGTGKNGLNKMIFALAPRRTPETYMAAASFDTDAKMNFFDFQDLVDTPNPIDLIVNETNSMLDPQAKTQIDAYVLLKEVNLGETTIYIIPCSSRQGSDCSVLLEKAGKRIRPEGFNCSYEN